MSRDAIAGKKPAKTAAKNNHNRRVGVWGEQVAAEYLVKHGYEIMEKNVYTPYGEIDLVCKHTDMLIFVEVKTRTNTELGFPEAGLTRRKATHLVKACEEYLLQRPNLPTDWSLDLIAVIGKPGDTTPQVDHFENVANES